MIYTAVSPASVYYRLFYYLEHHNITTSIYNALHFIYLPHINQLVKVFQEGWNDHGVRTEHNLSPNQLFVQGALELKRRGLHALEFFEHVNDTYDDTAVEDEYTVYVPPDHFSLTEENLADLQQSVNPLAECDNFAIDLYLETLTFLLTIVFNNPNVYTVQS